MCVCNCVSNEKVQKDVCQRYFTSLPYDVRFQSSFWEATQKREEKETSFFHLFWCVVVFFLLCFWAEEF